MSQAGFDIRPVRPEDVPAVVAMVHELAEFERAAQQCRLTPHQLSAALFGPSPALFAHVAVAAGSGELVGVALWFLNYSTWDGVHGVGLEDLYVRPSARGRGVGTALLRTLAALCVQRGYTRLQWWVLDWNAEAVEFYRRLGATSLDEWTVQRVSGGALAELAGLSLPRVVPTT